MKTKSVYNKIVADVGIKDITTSGRRAEIARLILAGETKDSILRWLMDTFGMQYKQAYTEWRQGFVYIYLQCELEKEEIRKVNLARLEALFDKAESELKGKDYYNTQMKNIDLVNKTAGLYDARQEGGDQDTDIDFKLSIPSTGTEEGDGR